MIYKSLDTFRKFTYGILSARVDKSLYSPSLALFFYFLTPRWIGKVLLFYTVLKSVAHMVSRICVNLSCSLDLLFLFFFRLDYSLLAYSKNLWLVCTVSEISASTANLTKTKSRKLMFWSIPTKVFVSMLYSSKINSILSTLLTA